jgi:hypothetical protein
MALIRPRLNDFYNLPFTQEEVDFAIPFLDEDIPLFVDPFLLWKSRSMQDNSLHTLLLNSFNYLGKLTLEGREEEAVTALVRSSECREVGLGMSKSRRGVRISPETAGDVILLFKNIPQVRMAGFAHVEEIQLLVDNISRDRISDFACSFLKSFLIDYTIAQAIKHEIPRQKVTVLDVYDFQRRSFYDEEVSVPYNPETSDPILLVPKHWLRHLPWINFEDYARDFFPEKVDDRLEQDSGRRGAVLTYNRHHYDAVRAFVETKERTQDDCHNDPLFRPIPVLSARRKLGTIIKLPSGITAKADRTYEDSVSQLMASLLYPDLDFATEQSRVDSGVLIRDLIFYNNRSLDFLTDIYNDFGARQIVMELKNVAKVERDHINQLNRYLGEHLGKFGVLVTRNPLPKNLVKNTIDLWAGQRKCIIALTDEDLKTMVSVYETKQRKPVEVLKRAYIEFIRACPS